jgi:hypothetical protein
MATVRCGMNCRCKAQKVLNEQPPDTVWVAVSEARMGDVKAAREPECWTRVQLTKRDFSHRIHHDCGGLAAGVPPSVAAAPFGSRLAVRNLLPSLSRSVSRLLSKMRLKSLNRWSAS